MRGPSTGGDNPACRVPSPIVEPVGSPTPLQRAIPNALTLSRVVLAVAFFAILSLSPYAASDRFRALAPLAGNDHPPPIDVRYALAALIFILAAVTDALDGHLARRWRVITQFGRVMDPFADKILILGAFTILAGSEFFIPATSIPHGTLGPMQVSGVAAWMAVIVLARELLVTSIRGAFESRGVAFPASMSGKIKMILQSICISAILLILAAGNPTRSLGRQAILALVWSTVVITAWSGIPYITRAIAAAKPKTKDPSAPI